MKPECDWEYIPDTAGMSEVLQLLPVHYMRGGDSEHAR